MFDLFSDGEDYCLLQNDHQLKDASRSMLKEGNSYVRIYVTHDNQRPSAVFGRSPKNVNHNPNDSDEKMKAPKNIENPVSDGPQQHDKPNPQRPFLWGSPSSCSIFDDVSSLGSSLIDFVQHATRRARVEVEKVNNLFLR